jgi:hypothetical protein
VKKIILVLLALAIAFVLFFVRRSSENISVTEESTKSNSVDTAVSTQEIAKPAETKKMPETFQQLAEKTWSTIPKLADLQKLSKEELHGTPKPIKAAALALGDLAQSIADHPEQKQDGYLFYEKCTEEKTFPTSVRATCLKNYRKLGADLRQRVDESNLPQGLRMLADKLED